MSVQSKTFLEDMNKVPSKVIDELTSLVGLPVPERVANAESLYAEWDTLKSQWGGVGNIPHDKLGDFLDKWSQLIAYAKWVEASADIRQAKSREARDTLKTMLFAEFDGSREIRASLVMNDPDFIRLEIEYTTELTRLLAVRALREGYESRYASISREISRRTGEFSTMRRG